MSDSELPVVIIGDGWSAVGAAAHYGAEGVALEWMTGAHPGQWAPLPAMEAGEGVSALQTLLEKLDLECGEPQTGVFLREFRNKAFREPSWSHAAEMDERRKIRDKSLSSNEQRFASLQEVRLDRSLTEVEQLLRQKISEMPHVSRTETGPLTEIRTTGEVREVVFASGEVKKFSRLIFCGHWWKLARVDGAPVGLIPSQGSGKELAPGEVTRKWECSAFLQIAFNHGRALGGGLNHGFFSALTRDSGQSGERHVWGHFLETTSHWTVFLGTDEVEDNHLIMKKIRRIKQALNRTFVGEEWLGSGNEKFMDTVIGEQVRFVDSAFFSKGTPLDCPYVAAQDGEGMIFLTDGFGPGSALAQLGVLTGLENWQPGEMPRVQAHQTASLSESLHSTVSDPAPDPSFS